MAKRTKTREKEGWGEANGGVWNESGFVQGRGGGVQIDFHLNTSHSQDLAGCSHGNSGPSLDLCAWVLVYILLCVCVCVVTSLLDTFSQLVSLQRPGPTSRSHFRGDSAVALFPDIKHYFYSGELSGLHWNTFETADRVSTYCFWQYRANTRESKVSSGIRSRIRTDNREHGLHRWTVENDGQICNINAWTDWGKYHCYNHQ